MTTSFPDCNNQPVHKHVIELPEVVEVHEDESREVDEQWPDFVENEGYWFPEHDFAGNFLRDLE